MTHVLITGDTGTGSIYQKKVAKMIQEKEDEDTDGCILVGDNLYEGGATDVEDDQFEDKFEKIYKDCKSKFSLNSEKAFLKLSWKPQIDLKNGLKLLQNKKLAP